MTQLTQRATEGEWNNLEYLQAQIVESTSDSITVRSVSASCDLHVRLVRDNVTTMESMLRAAAARWQDKPCLGTRTVLSEEDEPQANGRVFKKVINLTNPSQLGIGKWKTIFFIETIFMRLTTIKYLNP